MNERQISRRTFVKAGLAAGSTLATHPIHSVSANRATAKPNVLVIFSDQQHWHAMGFMDSLGPESQTNHVDQNLVPDTAGSPVFIGKRSANIAGNFKGAMHCFMVFDKALTLDEILRIKKYCETKGRTGEYMNVL